MDLKDKTIFVGLSGGVDSAVTAALLQEAGAHVVGVFIKGWYPEGLPCTWTADRRDAMHVAAHLAIPFHTLDASAEYKKSVIDYLIREYGTGRTPNPDIMCNRDVKFGAFYEFAKAHGADFIATGHYARKEDRMLLRGVDPEKDQSYFLWAISPEALAHTFFPLGGLHKSEVRALAKKYNLPNAEKRDSQGICFLGPVSMDEFLRAELPTTSGPVIDEQNTSVGTHDGVLLYTLGERFHPKNAPAGPWYVVRKEIPNNCIVVSRERKAPEPVASFELSDVNWFEKPTNTAYEAQYRYHGPRAHGTIAGGSFIPNEPLAEAIAPGQSLVIYKEEQVIGGGIIN